MTKFYPYFSKHGTDSTHFCLSNCITSRQPTFTTTCQSIINYKYSIALLQSATEREVPTAVQNNTLVDIFQPDFVSVNVRPGGDWVKGAGGRTLERYSRSEQTFSSLMQTAGCSCLCTLSQAYASSKCEAQKAKIFSETTPQHSF